MYTRRVINYAISIVSVRMYSRGSARGTLKRTLEQLVYPVTGLTTRSHRFEEITSSMYNNWEVVETRPSVPFYVLLVSQPERGLQYTHLFVLSPVVSQKMIFHTPRARVRSAHIMIIFVFFLCYGEINDRRTNFRRNR